MLSSANGLLRGGRQYHTGSRLHVPPPPPTTPLPLPKHANQQAPSLSDRLVHLCNHSVQKQQDRRGDENSAASASATVTGVNDDSGSSKGAGSGGGTETLPSGSQQNMWTAGQLRHHLRQRFQVVLVSLRRLARLQMPLWDVCPRRREWLLALSEFKPTRVSTQWQAMWTNLWNVVVNALPR